MSETLDGITMLPVVLNGHEGRATAQIREFMGIRSWLDGRAECCSCGQWLRTEIGPDEVRVTNPCSMPDGVTTVVKLAVPSGRLVVDDDLRPVYEPDDAGFTTYNSAAGQAQYVEAMAALGCAYGPVGNTCPSLYRTGDGSYVVASPAWTGDDEDTEVLPEGWTELAGICTDLWAYSIADHDDFLAKGGSLESPGNTRTVVDVPAGVYVFTLHTGERSFYERGAEPTIYAHIELEQQR